MRAAHVELLRCIACTGDLTVSPRHPGRVERDEIEEAVLACTQCGALYPVIFGAGVFFPRDAVGGYLNAEEKKACDRLGLDWMTKDSPIDPNHRKRLAVAENWSYQWNEVYRYAEKELEGSGFFGSEIFFTFIRIAPGEFRDKTVIVWCGGRGKEAYHIAKHGPKLLIVNEMGDEIYHIRRIVPEGTNLLVIRCDMTMNPLKDEIADYSICDHALQHVEDHRLGFTRLASAIKPGGTVAINVYSYEHNVLMTHLVEPLKTVLHRLPIRIQRTIAFAPALLIYFVIHAVYIPAKRRLPERLSGTLPLFEHMMFWSRESLRFVWTACFDLVQAPISYHFKQHEVRDMAVANRMDIISLVNTHGTTWSLTAKKIRHGLW